MRRQSLFITFEGPEGSGKSTHSRLLCNFLRRKGFKVLHTREPGGTVISERIRKILLDPKNKDMNVVCEMLLYMAARSQIVKKKILPALRKGYIVVCDRFMDATLAYQGYAGGIDLDTIRKVGALVAGKILPRLTFLLDIDVKEGLARAGKTKDRIERRSILFHKKVRKGYLAIARKEPGRVKIVPVVENIKKNQERIRKIIFKSCHLKI